MTGEQLVPRPTQAINPATGEVHALDAPSTELAESLNALKQWEAQARDFKRLVSRELHERMDRDASWTIHAPGIEVRGESPGRVEYDPELLPLALAELVEAGYISEDAAREACEQVTTYKPKVRGINQLRKLGGAVTERIDECATPVDPERRRITVKTREGA